MGPKNVTEQLQSLDSLCGFLGREEKLIPSLVVSGIRAHLQALRWQLRDLLFIVSEQHDLIQNLFAPPEWGCHHRTQIQGAGALWSYLVILKLLRCSNTILVIR